mmetsp:Transcript_1619/g.5199  ORF Transcript_1619/g.5199 Transcript_1619/m.5199 type:complete len:311 (+) Transcript_1619:51-983(+)
MPDDPVASPCNFGNCVSPQYLLNLSPSLTVCADRARKSAAFSCDVLLSPAAKAAAARLAGAPSSQASRSPKADRVRSVFYEAVDHPDFRASLADYHHSGYDRGHLSPAANHKGSQAAMDATFNLWNVTPQVGEGNNRHYWARLEAFARGLARTPATLAVYSCTGPAFVPRVLDGQKFMVHRYAKDVPVPTHLYKVVMRVRTLEAGAEARLPLDDRGHLLPGAAEHLAFDFAAFLVPNDPIPPEVPLSTFQVPMSKVERLVGTRFWPEARALRAHDLCTDERTGVDCVLPPPDWWKAHKKQKALPPPSSSS